MAAAINVGGVFGTSATSSMKVSITEAPPASVAVTVTVRGDPSGVTSVMVGVPPNTPAGVRVSQLAAGLTVWVKVMPVVLSTSSKSPLAPVA